MDGTKPRIPIIVPLSTLFVGLILSSFMEFLILFFRKFAICQHFSIIFRNQIYLLKFMKRPIVEVETHLHRSFSGEAGEAESPDGFAYYLWGVALRRSGESFEGFNLGTAVDEDLMEVKSSGKSGKKWEKVGTSTGISRNLREHLQKTSENHGICPSQKKSG